MTDALSPEATVDLIERVSTTAITAKVRKLRPKSGDLLVINAELDEEAFDRLQASINEMTQERFVIVVLRNPNEGLQALDETAMAGHGWIRRERITALEKNPFHKDDGEAKRQLGFLLAQGARK
jgi:hypothetical protein